MKKKNSDVKTGFTLVELIVVIAILGTLSAMAVPRFSGYTEKSKIKADEISLDLLNKMTDLYAVTHNINEEDVFAGIESDEAKIQKLVEEGLLDKVIEPQNKDASFLWGKDNIPKWSYVDKDKKPIVTLDEDNLSQSAEQIMTSLKSYIDNGMKEGVKIPSRNGPGGSIIYERHHKDNIFWDGYFESVNGLDKDEIQKLRVFFDFDENGYTSEIVGMYIRMQSGWRPTGPPKIIYFSNGEHIIPEGDNSYKDYLVEVGEYSKLVPPDSE